MGHPRGASDMLEDYWLAVVVEPLKEAQKKKTVHGCELKRGDVYVVLQWYEHVRDLGDGGREFALADGYDKYVLWQSGAVVPIKLKKQSAMSKRYAVQSAVHNKILAVLQPIRAD